MLLVCTVCNNKFERKGSRGPIPKYCGAKCVSVIQRSKPGRIEYEKQYYKQPIQKIRKQAYGFRYNRRPEVRARNRKRMFLKWHTNEEYRQQQLERLRSYERVRNPLKNVEIHNPYTGHRWLDKAREAVTQKHIDPLAPWSDDKYDEMGEALLALLEGRDMNEAIKEFRSKEFIPRHLTKRMSDYREDRDETKWFDEALPSEPSAEDEVITRESISVLIHNNGIGPGKRSRHMKHKTQQPSRRRMKDGKSWQR